MLGSYTTLSEPGGKKIEISILYFENIRLNVLRNRISSILKMMKHTS